MSGIDVVIDYITDAINADADPQAEAYARIVELPMPEGPCATVMVLSGRHHDLLCEFVQERYPTARKVRPS